AVVLLRFEFPEYGPANTPRAVLSAPVVLLSRAARPIAVFSPPIVVFCSARSPVAVLDSPVVFNCKAKRPVPVFELPGVLAESTSQPVATLPIPELRTESTPEPTPTLSVPVALGLPVPNPTKRLVEEDPYAKGNPCRSKAEVAFRVLLVTVPEVLRFPVIVSLLVKMLAAPSCGTFVVSRFSVTLPVVPPPVSAVP